MKGIHIYILGVVIVAATFVAPARSRSLRQTSFENIKVLTDMSDSDIRKEMMNWTEALAVNCNHCHIAGDFPSEANPKKDIARKMATMVKTINKDFLDGKASCVLCHRGSAIPAP